MAAKPDPQTAGVTANLRAVSFIDPQHGWIAGERGIVLRTEDGGAKWLAKPLPSKLDLHAIFFLPPAKAG